MVLLVYVEGALRRDGLKKWGYFYLPLLICSQNVIFETIRGDRNSWHGRAACAEKGERRKLRTSKWKTILRLRPENLLVIFSVLSDSKEITSIPKVRGGLFETIFYSWENIFQFVDLFFLRSWGGEGVRIFCLVYSPFGHKSVLSRILCGGG